MTAGSSQSLGTHVGLLLLEGRGLVQREDRKEILDLLPAGLESAWLEDDEQPLPESVYPLVAHTIPTLILQRARAGADSRDRRGSCLSPRP